MPKKRTPPRPKSTANLPKGLAAYWAARGVPSKAPAGGGSSPSKSTGKKATSKKTTRKRTTRKKSSAKKK